MSNRFSVCASKKLTQMLSLFFICILLVSSTVPVFAADDDDKETFYTTDEDTLDDLFSLTVANVKDATKNPMGFLTSGKTFIVVRDYEDDKGKHHYKVYVNVPDIAQYIRNLVLKSVSDGWEDKMYVPESRMIEEVGKNDDNVINKFGFNIPVNKYSGEYPIISMSLAGILPVKWYQKIFRGLKALLGLSFVNAPDKENFRTLFYFNQEYINANDEQLIQFIQDYWLEYFVKALWSNEEEYFRDAEDLRVQLVTEDEYQEAKSSLKEYKSEIKEARKVKQEEEDFNNTYNLENAEDSCPGYKEALDEYNKNVDTISTKYGYTDIEQFKEDVRNNKINLTTDEKTKLTQPHWEDFRNSSGAKPPKALSKKQDELLKNAVEWENTVERYKNFEDRWDAGVKKNAVAYGSGLSDPSGSVLSDNYEFSYAQCFLDISYEDMEENDDKNDCTKNIDGQPVTASVVEVFVNSGIYRIGLTDESKEGLSNSTDGEKLMIPVEGEVDPETGKGITSYFGGRTPPKSGASSNHGGIDIAYGGINGSPVLASAGGTVKLAGTNGGYGNCIIIEHNGVIDTLYGHLSAISVSKGDTVSAGQQIGKVGSTGVSTGPHLHFEVHKEGKKVDPCEYLDTTVAGGSSKPLEYKDKLSRKESVKILRILQNKLGPAYQEVVNNIITCMINNAKAKGEEIELKEIIDSRVMPYDRDTLIPSAGGSDETEDFNGGIIVNDPRVEIYKNENPIGGFISTGQFNPSSILYNKAVSKMAINTCGSLAQLSVFCNHITNFKIFDDIGLSPTTMWKSAPSTIVISLLLAMMIINIIIYAFRYIKGRAGVVQIVGRVIVFLALVSLVMMFTIYPQQTWNNYKRVFNGLNSTDAMTVKSTMNNVDELYGDGDDSSVTYYLPYFNFWTLYNTGYNIYDDEQKIDKSDPEAEDMKGPKINGEETTLWPVVLADSFNINGYNKQSVDADNRNGPSVNPNAYRAVDHFLAPRLTSKNPSKNALNLSNSVNENYNGKFQKISIFDAIGCVAASINLLLIAIIKMLTFIWAWYLLYIFIFEVLLSSSGKHGQGIKQVITRTFSPLLMIAVIGLYAGIIVELSMLATGFIGVVINIVCIWLTVKLVAIWRNDMPNSFPAPLKFIAALGSIQQYKIRRQERKLQDDMYYNLEKAGVTMNEDGTYNASFIDDEGNYIGGTEEEERAYNDIMREAQLKAQMDKNYDRVTDERIKYRMKELDKIQNADAGMADISSKYLTDGSENLSIVNQSSSTTQSNSSTTQSSTTKKTPSSSDQDNKSQGSSSSSGYQGKVLNSSSKQQKPNKSASNVGKSDKIGEDGNNKPKNGERERAQKQEIKKKK